jgi:ribosomal protein L29
MAKKKETAPKDIESTLGELKEKMRSIKFSLAGARSKNVKEQKTLRREIARYETAKSAAAKEKKE